jgi:hypothetical protein
MLRWPALRIKLCCKPFRELRMERTESQFGPPSDALFSREKWANSRFLPLEPLVGLKHSLKEVAVHETFAGFFRLNR